MIVGAIPAYNSVGDYLILASGFAFWLSSFLFIEWLEERSKR